ncbi:MAG: hypothetical protein RLN86_12065 [Cyclobacteriaceae bacterium]
MTKNIIIGLLVLLLLALLVSTIYWNTEAHRQELIAYENASEFQAQLQACKAEAEQQMMMSMQAAEASHMEALKQREIALQCEARLLECKERR